MRDALKIDVSQFTNDLEVFRLQPPPLGLPVSNIRTGFLDISLCKYKDEKWHSVLPSDHKKKQKKI